MPQPVATRTREQGTKLLLKRPNCAIRIAAIAAEWTRVETALAFMFGAAFGESQLASDGSGSKSVTHDWVALKTMQELETIRVKFNVIRNVLVPLLEKDLAEKWDKLEKKLKTASSKRNEIIHADWFISEEFPDDLIRVNDDANSTRYVEKDFQFILDLISATCDETYEFAELVMAAQREGWLRRR